MPRVPIVPVFRVAEKLGAHKRKRQARIFNLYHGYVFGHGKVEVIAYNKSRRALPDGGLSEFMPVRGISLKADKGGALLSLARIVNKVGYLRPGFADKGIVNIL